MVLSKGLFCVCFGLEQQYLIFFLHDGMHDLLNESRRTHNKHKQITVQSPPKTIAKICKVGYSVAIMNNLKKVISGELETHKQINEIKTQFQSLDYRLSRQEEINEETRIRLNEVENISNHTIRELEDVKGLATGNSTRMELFEVEIEKIRKQVKTETFVTMLKYLCPFFCIMILFICVYKFMVFLTQ